MSAAEEQHDNGVHVNCVPAKPGNRTVGGNGSARACMVRARGATIERFHSHDFDGPLVCGCEDLAYS